MNINHDIESDDFQSTSSPNPLLQVFFTSMFVVAVFIVPPVAAVRFFIA